MVAGGWRGVDDDETRGRAGAEEGWDGRACELNGGPLCDALGAGAVMVVPLDKGGGGERGRSPIGKG